LIICRSALLRNGLFLISCFIIAICDAQEAQDDETFILATGRRLPYLYAISLAEALKPQNDNTENAIISRNKVSLDRLDGELLGDPANLLVSEDQSIVYVVNHHGSINNAEFRQHGGRGQIAVLNIAAALNPHNDNTPNALQSHFDSGGFGAIGLALLPEMLVVSNAENNLTEDGGNRVTFIDRSIGSLRGTVELALGSPDCDYPVPYVAPYGPPQNLPVLSPNPDWGCFPDPNGLAIGRSSNGSSYVFTANGGTNDVSVIDLARVLHGDLLAEIARISLDFSPWGMTSTPDGRYIIVASGRSQKDNSVGNAISIIDVDLVASGVESVVVSRVLIGTDNPEEPTLPLIPSVTPSGQEVIIPNLLSNNVSIVNIDLALAGDASAEIARIPLMRSDGEPARPRGSAITSDGKYAVISGGPSTQPFSQEVGHVYIIDLKLHEVVGTVTGIGNDPYGLATVTK